MLPESTILTIFHIVRDLLEDHPILKTTLSLLILSILVSLATISAFHFGILADDIELSNGKSPHSGFSPDFPNP